jgi:hypothetical protein
MSTLMSVSESKFRLCFQVAILVFVGVKFSYLLRYLELKSEIEIKLDVFLSC